MSIIDTINVLPDMISLIPATNVAISEAEIQLCVYFSDEYKEYISKFGAVIADGIELTGIAKSEHRNVVTVTKMERELNINVPKNLYVVENVGIDGIIIWQDQSGTIYQTRPNQEPVKIASSLEEYIKNTVSL